MCPGGAWGLSGRVLDLKLKSCWFETQIRHCFLSLSKMLYPLLSTGSEVRNCPGINEKIVDWDVKVNTKKHVPRD